MISFDDFAEALGRTASVAEAQAELQRTIEALGYASLDYGVAAKGKTAWETSMILGLSERVVKKHVASAAVRLGAVTRAQAVAVAISRGLIRP